MNTVDNWNLTVRIDDTVKREVYRDVFFDGIIPIKSPNAELMENVQGDVVEVYEVDLYALSDYLLDQLLRVFADRVGVDLGLVKDLLSEGMYVWAEGVCLIYQSAPVEV